MQLGNAASSRASEASISEQKGIVLQSHCKKRTAGRQEHHLTTKRSPQNGLGSDARLGDDQASPHAVFPKNKDGATVFSPSAAER